LIISASATADRGAPGRRGHGADAAGPVFRPVTNNRTGELDQPLDPGSVYHNIVLKYGREDPRRPASAPK